SLCRLRLFSHVLLPPRSTFFPYTTLFRSSGCCTSGSFVPGRSWDGGSGVRLCASQDYGGFQYWPRCRAPGRSDRRRQFGCLRERSEEHTSELQSLAYLVCRLLLEKKKKKI